MGTGESCLGIGLEISGIKGLHIPYLGDNSYSPDPRFVSMDPSSKKTRTIGEDVKASRE